MNQSNHLNKIAKLLGTVIDLAEHALPVHRTVTSERANAAKLFLTLVLTLKVKREFLAGFPDIDISELKGSVKEMLINLINNVNEMSEQRQVVVNQTNATLARILNFLNDYQYVLPEYKKRTLDEFIEREVLDTTYHRNTLRSQGKDNEVIFLVHKAHALELSVYTAAISVREELKIAIKLLFDEITITLVEISGDTQV